jgi:hypothetical protein
MFGELTIEIAADRPFGFLISVEMDFRASIAPLKGEKLVVLMIDTSRHYSYQRWNHAQTHKVDLLESRSDLVCPATGMVKAYPKTFGRKLYITPLQRSPYRNQVFAQTLIRSC